MMTQTKLAKIRRESGVKDLEYLPDLWKVEYRAYERSLQNDAEAWVRPDTLIPWAEAPECAVFQTPFGEGPCCNDRDRAYSRYAQKVSNPFRGGTLLQLQSQGPVHTHTGFQTPFGEGPCCNDSVGGSPRMCCGLGGVGRCGTCHH